MKYCCRDWRAPFGRVIAGVVVTLALLGAAPPSGSNNSVTAACRLEQNDQRQSASQLRVAQNLYKGRARQLSREKLVYSRRLARFAKQIENAQAQLERITSEQDAVLNEFTQSEQFVQCGGYSCPRYASLLESFAQRLRDAENAVETVYQARSAYVTSGNKRIAKLSSEVTLSAQALATAQTRADEQAKRLAFCLEAEARRRSIDQTPRLVPTARG